MRFVFLFLLFCGISLPAFAASKGAYHHHFALEGEYLLWRRAKSLSKPLAKAAGGPISTNPSPIPSECAKEVGKPLLRSSQLVHDMHFDAGVRVSAKLFYSIYSTWALTYTGGFHWKGEEKRHCPENLDLPGTLGQTSVDYHYADRVQGVYNSDFYTIDLSYFYHMTPRYADYFSVSWMIGLRFLDLDEKLKLYYTKGNDTSRYRVKTFNRALGPFFGGVFECNPYRFLTWGLAGNVGGLFNRGKQDTLMLDQNDTEVVRDYNPSGSNFAYFAHLYPYFELRPVKFFTFRFGYEMLYIGRMALADHQLNFNATGNHLNHDGNVIYHGLFAGIQFNF